jgi:Endoribonuclease XendoU
VDTSVFKQRATYKTFIALLDNYNAETGVQESVSSAERREVQDFITAVMQTKPMQYCHLYCRAKNPNMVPAGQNDFADLLKTIWFELYRRSGQVDSSGFGTCLGLRKLCRLFSRMLLPIYTPRWDLLRYSFSKAVIALVLSCSFGVYVYMHTTCHRNVTPIRCFVPNSIHMLFALPQRLTG